MTTSRSIRPRLASAYFGLEATFCTTPSMTRIFPIEGTVELGVEQEQLTNAELRHNVFDALAPVHGLKGGTLKFSCYLRPDATQLGASAAYAQNWLGLPLKACFGGQYPTPGTFAAPTITGVPTATSIPVTDGTLAAKSSILLVPVAGALEPVRVINIVTNTLTNSPASSAAASTGQAFDCWNYYLTQATPPSFTFQFALADDTSQEWTLNGCVMTGMELELTNGQLPKVTFTAKVGTWTGPSNQLIGSSTAANPMAAPFPIRSNQLILQAVATGAYPTAFFGAETFTVSVDLGLDYAMDLVGTEGKGGVIRTGGRPAATLKARVYPDIAGGNTTFDGTWWASRTPLQAMFRAATGSGLTKRWLVVDVPTLVLTTKPKPVMETGKLLRYDIEGQAMLSTSVTSGSTDQDLSPLLLAYG